MNPLSSLAGRLRGANGFALSVDWKASFFDRDAVADKALAQSRAALSRLGAYTRRVARNSIKVKGAAKPAPKPGTKAYDKWEREKASRPRSKPGSPIFQHTANSVVYPRNIWFAKDGADSVIVGMAKFTTTTAVPVPASIEFGETKKAKNPRRRTRRIGSGGEIRTDGRHSKTTKIAKRTRMGDVAVVYAKLRTQAQVDRANQINAELYGDDEYAITTAERPVMGLALSKAALKFDDAFEGRLSG